MRQNSLKSCMTLSTAMGLLFSVVPLAIASDTVKLDEEQTLTASRPVSGQDTVTIEYPSWFFRTTLEISRQEYENKQNLEQKYPGYRLVEKPLAVEKQEKEETVKILYKGWLGSSVLDIPKSEYENSALFAQKYPGYTLLIIEEKALISQEETQPKPKVSIRDLKKALDSVSTEDDLTMSRIVSLVQKTKEKNEVEGTPVVVKVCTDEE